MPHQDDLAQKLLSGRAEEALNTYAVPCYSGKGHREVRIHMVDMVVVVLTFILNLVGYVVMYIGIAI